MHNGDSSPVGTKRNDLLSPGTPSGKAFKPYRGESNCIQSTLAEKPHNCRVSEWKKKVPCPSLHATKKVG